MLKLSTDSAELARFDREIPEVHIEEVREFCLEQRIDLASVELPLSWPATTGVRQPTTGGVRHDPLRN